MGTTSGRSDPRERAIAEGGCVVNESMRKGCGKRSGSAGWQEEEQERKSRKRRRWRVVAMSLMVFGGKWTAEVGANPASRLQSAVQLARAGEILQGSFAVFQRSGSAPRRPHGPLRR